MPHPFAKLKHHEFDGQHRWEINKPNYPLERIKADFSDGESVLRTSRVKDIPFLGFFMVPPK